MEYVPRGPRVPCIREVRARRNCADYGWGPKNRRRRPMLSEWLTPIKARELQVRVEKDQYEEKDGPYVEGEEEDDDEAVDLGCNAPDGLTEDGSGQLPFSAPGCTNLYCPALLQ